MSKRKRIKKSNLRRFASDNINVYQGPNPDQIAAYHRRVVSGHGPKNNREPILEHTFNRIIRDGRVMIIRCTCQINQSFRTELEFRTHVRTRKIRRGKTFVLDPDRFDNHLAEYEPEVTYTEPQLPIEETYDVYDKRGKKIRVELHEHPLAARKDRELELWQSTRRQGFKTWHWSTLYEEQGYLLIRLGMCEDIFKFRKIYETYFIESLTYSSRAAAEAAFDSATIRWFKKEHPLTEL